MSVTRRNKVGPGPDETEALAQSPDASTVTIVGETVTAAAADAQAEKENERLHNRAKQKFLRQALLREVQNFSDYTHICGFERIFNAKFFILRLMWFFIFFIALGLTLYQLIQLIIRYQRNEDLKVTVNRRPTHSLKYPHITICDTNVLSWSKLKKSADFNRVVAIAHLQGTHAHSDP